ncbi:tubulin-specific chaperone A isoform X1 [Saimiri boliviensis]|uniref:tubulin-specific chaperone A isoform X1 n=1 Tax=Saimiri boliviensis TaxID=27679 RepID=UPI00193EB854|nr:tubulin-specific chaperone A isoform X1 [Saimiri boliviensis boliviensis]
MADPRVRQIKIKTGVVKRLVKEKVMYEKEAKQQEEKIEKMRAEDGENYDIKKQVEILQESRMMIPDCQRRLEAAYLDLQQILVSKDFCVLYLKTFFSIQYMESQKFKYLTLRISGDISYSLALCATTF